jgi:hypothetical protein
MLPDSAQTVLAVQPAGRVTIPLAEAILGLTRKAIEGKVYRGDWIEGREYHRAPDGSIWVNVEGVQRWGSNRSAGHRRNPQKSSRL